MSRVEFAVEKVKHLDETQAEALLEWLEQRESREALRQKLDAEIEVGLTQLRRGEKLPVNRFTRKFANAAASGARGKMAEFFYSPEAR